MCWYYCSNCLYFCQEVRCSLVSNIRLNSEYLCYCHFWGCAIAQTDNYLLLWKDTGAGFFHIALVIVILSPFVCTSLSLFPEVCGSPDQAARYHILVQKSVSNILHSTSKYIVPLLKQRWVSSSVHELWNKCMVVLTFFYTCQ